MTEPRLFAAIYTDEDVTGRLAVALRQRGFEAITAHEAGLASDADETHLTYAAGCQMALLTCNRDDFIRLGRERRATRERKIPEMVFANRDSGDSSLRSE